MNEITKKKFMPIWLKVGLLLVGIILIIVGLLKIFGGSGASNAFVNKFNELQAPGVEIKNNFTNVSGLLNGIGPKEANKDYAAIISDLQTALAKLNDTIAKITSMSATLTEFQNMVNNSSDKNVKTTGALFIEAINSRNAAVLKMASDTKDLINQALAYYKEMLHNQKVTLDINKYNATANTIVSDGQNMTNIGAQYDAAANNFAKAAGFTIDKK